MQLIPRLVLHKDATTFLCRPSADDESVPLNAGRLYIDMGPDDDCDDASSTSSASGISSSSSESSLESLLLNSDDEASDDDKDPFVSPLGTASPPDSSLFYSKNEVHAFGKARVNVESTVAGAQEAAKKTIKGAEKVVKQTGKVARKTVKQTGKAARKTVKQTGKAAKKTGKVAKKTVKGAEKVVKQTANATVALPLEQSSHWPNLAMLVLLLALGPVCLSLLVPLTILRDVDEGLSANRWFLYATHSVTQLFLVIPFIATYHYAMPDAEIPVRSRILAVFVGAVAGMVAVGSISEAKKVFPIPFSFIISMVVGIFTSMPTLYYLTPMRNDPREGEKIRKQFRFCFGLLLSYLFALVAACLWAVKFLQLYESPWFQTAWVLFYQVMEFIFKIVLAANITTRVNPERWLQLNLIVDLIFLYVQLAVLPFFANWASVIVSVVSMMLSMFWRAYSGVDRLQQFLPKVKDVVASAEGPAAAVMGIGELAANLTIAPVGDINAVNDDVQLQGNGAQQQGLHEWDLQDCSEQGTVEKKVIERTQTEETESTSDSESLKSNAIKDKPAEPLEEVSEAQRPLYHIVDSVSSAVLQVVVRLSTIMTFLFVRYLPNTNDHVNESFQVSDEQWRVVVGYAAVFLVGVITVLAGVGIYIRYKAKNLGGLTLSRVLAYMFRDSFWFIFLWLVCFQFFGIALIFDHFGADFTLEFDWLDCEEGRVEWPICVPTAPGI